MSSLNEKYLLSPFINWIVLLSKLRKKDIFLSHSDKNREDNLLFNCSVEQNMDDNEDMLDIDSLFDEGTESSMIFSFIYCIIAFIAFIFLIFLFQAWETTKVYIMWPALKLLPLLWTTLLAIRGMFLYISCLLFVCCCSFMWYSNCLLMATYISIIIIQPLIFFVHMDITKALQLLLPSSSGPCQKSSISISPIYIYQSPFCQFMKPTRMNIILFQEIGSMVFSKSPSQ